MLRRASLEGDQLPVGEGASEGSFPRAPARPKHRAAEVPVLGEGVASQGLKYPSSCSCQGGCFPHAVQRHWSQSSVIILFTDEQLCHLFSGH